MKLLIVTVVKAFEQDILRLFKNAQIENFSESHIDGYKVRSSVLRAASWFPSETGGVESSLFFSFTTEEKIEVLFRSITEFNNHLETNNPIRAVVVPIEKFI